METKIYKVNVINHKKIDGHIAYILSVQNPRTGLNITFVERYSNLRNLYELMKKESSNKNFPSFPPKKFFGYEDEKFVIKREKDLNEFFEKINADENFSKLSSLIKYIEANLEKNLKKEEVSSRQIQYSKQSQIYNKNMINCIKGKRLTQEEYKKECIEGKKIVDDYKLKFISLDYDIDIKNNEKIEKKYENLMRDKLIFNDEDKDDLSNMDIGNEDNLKMIGNKEDHFIDIVSKIKHIIDENIEKYSSMNKMMDSDEFLLQ